MHDGMTWIAGKPVHYRRLATASGRAFAVPEHIVRIDGEEGCGWQLRYGEWTDFPDDAGVRADPAEALERAIREMEFRLNTLGK
jgi:hypothetical protein